MPWTDTRRLRRFWIELAPRTFARCATPDDLELGLLGERLAERELRARGWTVLGRRQRSAAVEIDLVAREPAKAPRENGRLVLVEVKTKRWEELPRRRGASSTEHAELEHAANRRWRPGLRFDRDRIARLETTARALTRRGEARPRVDLIEVWIGPRGRRIAFEHHAGLDRPLET
ncbi:MAG: YraN family protein [Planctomycetes bacterium]|nr:YraN family protein [Planctomycetota bacterium]